MKRNVYATIAIKPIIYPETLEVRLYPLSRKTDNWLGGVFSMSPHRTLEWILQHYPVNDAAFKETDSYLRVGEEANLVRGEFLVELPDDAVWPEDPI